MQSRSAFPAFGGPVGQRAGGAARATRATKSHLPPATARAAPTVDVGSIDCLAHFDGLLRDALKLVRHSSIGVPDQSPLGKLLAEIKRDISGLLTSKARRAVLRRMPAVAEELAADVLEAAKNAMRDKPAADDLGDFARLCRITSAAISIMSHVGSDAAAGLLLITYVKAVAASAAGQLDARGSTDERLARVSRRIPELPGLVIDEFNELYRLLMETHEATSNADPDSEEAAVFSLIDGFKRRVEAAAAAKNRAAAAELFFSMCCENDVNTSVGAILSIMTSQEQCNGGWRYARELGLPDLAALGATGPGRWRPAVAHAAFAAALPGVSREVLAVYDTCDNIVSAAVFELQRGMQVCMRGLEDGAARLGCADVLAGHDLAEHFAEAKALIQRQEEAAAAGFAAAEQHRAELRTELTDLRSESRRHATRRERNAAEQVEDLKAHGRALHAAQKAEAEAREARELERADKLQAAIEELGRKQEQQAAAQTAALEAWLDERLKQQAAAHAEHEQRVQQLMQLAQQLGHQLAKETSRQLGPLAWKLDGVEAQLEGVEQQLREMDAFKRKEAELMAGLNQVLFDEVQEAKAFAGQAVSARWAEESVRRLPDEIQELMRLELLKAAVEGMFVYPGAAAASHAAGDAASSGAAGGGGEAKLELEQSGRTTLAQIDSDGASSGGPASAEGSVAS